MVRVWGCGDWCCAFVGCGDCLVVKDGLFCVMWCLCAGVKIGVWFLLCVIVCISWLLVVIERTWWVAVLV